MAFDKNQFNTLFPSYLSESEKGRLQKALNQFKDSGGNQSQWKQKHYSNFYLQNSPDYFLKGDVVKEIRFALWNKDAKDYSKRYTSAIILSNECDIFRGNIRDMTKQCVFAPIIAMSTYITKLKQHDISDERIKIIDQEIKSQQRSNLFYLPPNHVNNEDYIIPLDEVFWFPTDELSKYQENIEQNRLLTLDWFGLYLFILKISFHFCRLPEENDRTPTIIDKPKKNDSWFLKIKEFFKYNGKILGYGAKKLP